jgi:uncharacterized membrane protein
VAHPAAPSAGTLDDATVAERVATPARPAVLALPFALAAAGLYLAIGLVRYAGGGAGNYDLGIFSQAARSWSEGRLPGSAIRVLDNLFADHVSPVTAVLGVAWRLWPDPRALLVTQALTLGLAVWILGVAAFRRLPVVAAAVLVVAAALAKGVVSAAVFDVHETGLGAPLAAGLAYGLLERRRRITVGCALGLLLVKEDLGLTVAVAGLLWAWHRDDPADRRTGALLVAAGLAGVAVSIAIVLAVNPEHTSPYLQFLTGASGNPQGLPGLDVRGGHRWEPLVLFAVTAGLVGLRSPLALLALPTLAWRAVSSNEAYWQTYFHYDVLLVPVAAFALLDVVSRAPSGRLRLRPALIALPFVAVAAGLGVAKAASWPVLVPAAYRLTPSLTAASELAARVPPGSAVVAQQDLGPPLIARYDVRMLSPLPAGPASWVLLTPGGSQLGASQAAKQAWLEAASRAGARTQTLDGVTLVELPGPQVVRLPAPTG